MIKYIKLIKLTNTTSFKSFPTSKESAILKANGVNIIIALGHSGLDVDKLIAEKCNDVDVVIGGHSHTFLYTGTPPDAEVPVSTYPVIVQRGGRQVPVVQAYAFTKYLGYLHLSVSCIYLLYIIVMRSGIFNKYSFCILIILYCSSMRTVIY